MAHIASAKRGVKRLHDRHDAMRRENGFETGKQLVQRRCLVHGHVVDRTAGVDWHHRRQQVRLHGILDIAKVAARAAVAMDLHLATCQHGRDPPWNHGSVGAVGILPLAEHVEVAQPHGAQPIATEKHVCIQLVDILRQRIGRQRLADALFHLGQIGVVAIGRAGRRIHERGHLRIARRHQHVKKAVDIGVTGGERVRDRARHRTQRGLVQDLVDAGDSLPAHARIADIPMQEREALPLAVGHETAHFVQVVLKAGRQIVQADDRLVEP